MKSGKKAFNDEDKAIQVAIIVKTKEFPPFNLSKRYMTVKTWLPQVTYPVSVDFIRLVAKLNLIINQSQKLIVP